MTTLTKSIGLLPTRHRRATIETASVARRIADWLSGAPRKDDDEKRTPLAKTFPFFGE
jgi:hypothetical protein